MSDAKTVKFQAYLPEDLRTRFKAKCVLQGATMNQVVVELIEAWTNENISDEGKPPLPTEGKEANGKKAGKSPVSH